MAVAGTAEILEREHELEALRAFLAAAREGQGRLVLVEAPAGMGKTSLLRAAVHTLDASFTHLRARASELERDFAFGCVRQLLEPAIARASDAERERLFTGAATYAHPLFRAGGSADGAAGAERSFSVLHGLYWLLNNLAAEGPVLLTIDDLHWSDIESLRFLNYLAPRIDGLALGVLATVRMEEAGPAELIQLKASPETIVLRPRPLSEHATLHFCEQRLQTKISHEFAAACRESTGGNPFYLEALLRDVQERGLPAEPAVAGRVRRIGPAAIAQALRLRLAGVPAEVLDVVRAAAVFGDGARLAELAALADISEEAAAHAADLLTGLFILKRAEGVEFAHPILREAVYADIGAHQLARAHARAADILAASGASAERVAAQIAGAEPEGVPERVALLRRVAADALRRGAPAAAAAWLSRALAEPPPDDHLAHVLLELGSAELRLARTAAIDHLAAAVRQLTEPLPLTIAALQLANALAMVGEADRAVQEIAAAIDGVEAANRELALVLEAELAAKSLHASLESRAAAAVRLDRLGGLRGDTPGERLVLASIASRQSRESESAAEAAAHIERGLAEGRLLTEQELDVVGPFYALLIGLLDTDALDLADRSVEEALAVARARASIPAMAYLIAHRGWFALRRGSVSQAEADARGALELLTAHGILLGRRFALGLLVESLIESGDLAAAQTVVDESDIIAEIPPGLVNNPLLEARGLLHLAQGRTHAGAQDLLEFGRRIERSGAANPLASRWRAHASLALAALGDAEAARLMAADDVERARRWGAASGVGIALRAAALVDAGPALDLLREAVEVLRHSPARLEHARALTDLGAALRRANRRTQAKQVLHDALLLADRCGASALAERARTELRAAGGRSRDPSRTAFDQLTVSERRVAELAARGRSNPEIAQTLFVTRKTVETHLGHIYRKLEIGGRGDLSRVLSSPASATSV